MKCDKISLYGTTNNTKCHRKLLCWPAVVHTQCTIHSQPLDRRPSPLGMLLGGSDICYCSKLDKMGGSGYEILFVPDSSGAFYLSTGVLDPQMWNTQWKCSTFGPLKEKTRKAKITKMNVILVIVQGVNLSELLMVESVMAFAATIAWSIEISRWKSVRLYQNRQGSWSCTEGRRHWGVNTITQSMNAGVWVHGAWRWGRCLVIQGGNYASYLVWMAPCIGQRLQASLVRY